MKRSRTLETFKKKRISILCKIGEVYLMAANIFFSGGPILLGILIAATTGLKWPQWLQYVWAAVAILFGVVVFAVL